MVCASVRSIIPLLKLGDYLSVQAHKPCSISQFIFIFNGTAAEMDSVNIFKACSHGRIDISTQSAEHRKKSS